MSKKIRIPMALIITIMIASCSVLEPFTDLSDGGDGGPEPTATGLDAVSPTQESEPDDGDTNESAAGVEPFPEPDPIHLDITLEEGNTAQAVIGPDGGTLEVVGGDGSRYVLEIPDGALVSPVTISMTPAAAVEGVPLSGGSQALVHLEPEGLVFYQPALLLIQPAAETDGIRMAYGSRDLGQDFHLYPGEEGEDGVRLTISHFSDYGTTDGQRAEIERLLDQYVPSQAESYTQNAITIITETVDDGDAEVDAIERVFRQWFNQTIEVRLKNAAVYPERFDAAVGEYLSWIFQIQLLSPLGGEPELKNRFSAEIDRAKDAIAAAVKSGMEDAYDQCVQENDPEGALRMYRYGLLAGGVDVWGRNGLDKSDASRKLRDCFKFEFVLRSFFEGGLDDGTKTSQVLSRVPLEIEEEDEIEPGYGSMDGGAEVVFEINKSDPTPPECEVLSDEGDMYVNVLADFNLYLSSPQVESVTVRFSFIEPPLERFRCSGQGRSYESTLNFWHGAFKLAYQGFLDGTQYEIELPIVKEGATYAKIDFETSIPEIDGEEKTTFKLDHKPGQ